MNIKTPGVHDALLEIGTEEIPASYLPPALAFIKSASEEFLRANHLPFQELLTVGTPRRMALLIWGLASKTESQTEEVWGPPMKAAKDSSNQWTQAALGFAESNGTDAQSLEVRNRKNAEYLCFVKKHSGQKCDKVLQTLFQQILPAIPFPKRMVWNATRFKFARPIRNLVCLLDQDILRFQIAGIKAWNKTFSLSHTSPQKITISSPKNYLTTLKNHCILADPIARKELILSSCQHLEVRVHGKLKADAALLEKVSWLVEHPVAVLCGFEKEFLSLPQEVLITCLKKHQKFFTILDESGHLTTHFIAVRNGFSEHQDSVRKGYEKVTQARLADAQFFYNEDLKKDLDFFVQKGSKILVQAKLGNLTDMISRMKQAGKFILAAVENFNSSCGINASQAERAIHLSKFDLSTSMVYEFPELQGIMGEIYAKQFGEPHEIAQAIREHYYPLTAQGVLPSNALSGIVSVADKIDHITGNFLVGNLPTGSSDAHGLKKQSAGLLRILIENRWDISVKALVEFTLEQFEFYKGFAQGEKEAALKQILTFLCDRFQLLVQDEGYPPDEIYAVTKNGASPDCEFLKVVSLREKVAALHSIRASSDFENIAVSYKRLANILRQAKAKNIHFSKETFKPELLKEKVEHELLSEIELLSRETAPLLRDKNYLEALKTFVKIGKTLNQFFEEVLVMDPDPLVSSNRLSLLSILESLLKEIADFSLVQASIKSA